MDEAQALLRGCTSVADRIRALGQAGYRRTEIRDLLGIRYQHVRNVLLRAGITGGLGADAAPECGAVEAGVPLLLRTCGFSQVGSWRLDGASLSVDQPVTAAPGLYAFVLDGQVMYVGISRTGLRSRMRNYGQGHAQQRTSRRVKAAILTALAAGGQVQVFAAHPEKVPWKGVHLDPMASAEAMLISEMRPPWNMQGLRDRRELRRAAGRPDASMA